MCKVPTKACFHKKFKVTLPINATTNKNSVELYCPQCYGELLEIQSSHIMKCIIHSNALPLINI
jgi:hypothetical protein